MDEQKLIKSLRNEIRKTIQESIHDRASDRSFPENLEDSQVFIDEIRYVLREMVFETMQRTIEVSSKPLISREEALTIIPRTAIEKGVTLGHMTKLRHGKKVYFDRLRFLRYITMVAPDKVKPQ